MKQTFILVHRWLGLVLSLLFVVWFQSGIVMMFVDGMPDLRARPQFWLRMPLLDFRTARLTPADAVKASGLRPQTLEMAMLEGRPVYRLGTDKGWTCVFADSGSVLSPLDGIQAQTAAKSWIRGTAAVEPAESIAVDQWTVGEDLRSYAPLWRVRVDDGKGTDVYVSAATGQVVQSVDAWDRFWGYLGPVLHWLYFTPLRRRVGLWSDVVIALSALGSLLCLSGLVVGVWQFLWRRFRSPFARPWMAWHHVLGLAFGLFAFTWVFSGMLSMDPFGTPAQGTGPLLADGPPDAVRASVTPEQALRRLGHGFDARELRLLQVGGRSYYLALAGARDSRLVPADSDGAPLARLDRATLERAFSDGLAGARVLSSQWLSGYDTYYYSKRRTRPLPVLKVVLDDRERTLYYLDPATGGVALRLGPYDRAMRWLYSGLHRWDFPFLRRSLRLWYWVVLPFMAAGLALSLTGLVLSWKWLMKKAGARVPD